MYTYVEKKHWFTVCCFKFDDVQFLHIFSGNKFAILRSADLLCLLNFIAENLSD